MYSMEIPKHFTMLRDISDTVDDYLGRELYKDDFNFDGELLDDYYPKDILGLCYRIILTELRERGVSFTVDDDDLTEDIYTCGYVYLVRKFADREYFINLVRATETLDEVEAYVNTDELKPNLLEDLVNIINNKIHTYELGEMSYILDRTYTNDVYLQFVKDCLAAARESPNSDNALKDIDATTEYVAHINLLRKMAKQYSYLIINKLHLDDYIDVSRINKLLRDYDRDKLDSDVIDTYAKIDTEEDLPLDLNILRKRYMDKHHKNSPHHKEYWLDPDNLMRPQFTISDLVVLMAHHVEPDITQEKFIEEAGETITSLSGTILTPDMQKLAVDMMQLLKQYIKNPDMSDK